MSIEDPNNEHFFPVNDLKRHITCGLYCHCKPTLIPTEKGVIVLHNSYSGIEFADAGAFPNEITYFETVWINDAPYAFNGH